MRFEIGNAPPAGAALEVLRRGGIALPGWTEERLARAFAGSAVIVTAWDGERLVGFARTISDLAWCAYLSQLVVLPERQKQGIGKELVSRTLEALGEEVSLLVHSAQAGPYYRGLGFEPYGDCYRIRRRR